MKVARIVGALVLLVLLTGCVRAVGPTPVPIVTRAPTPVPWPTLGLDEAPTDATTRALGSPSAPVLLGSPRTFVVTEYEDYCRWAGDVLLRWRHSNPPSVDYYEVWHGLNQPYSSPDLEGTTTALRWLSDAPGQDFVYNSGDYGIPSGCVGVSIAGDVDTWQVRACNRAGCSGPSNEIAVMSFSLRQGMPFPDFLAGAH